VHGQPQRPSRARDAAIGGDCELELHVVRQQWDEPQQRELGAAGLGRLRDREYA
jgi:hypothetical protein